MKKALFSISILHFFFLSSFAQIQPLWQTYFGGPGDDRASHTIVLQDGNFLIGGSATSQIYTQMSLGVNTVYSGGDMDIFLAKYTPQGELIWWTYYGSSARESLIQIEEDEFGNIWILGFTNGNPPVSQGAIKETQVGVLVSDCFISKLDHNGNWLEGTLLGGENYEFPVGFKLSGGEILIAGQTYSSGLATPDAPKGELTMEGEGFYAVLSSVYDLSYFTYIDAGVIGNRFTPYHGYIKETGDLICLASYEGTISNTESWLPYSAPFENENTVLMRITTSGVVLYASYYTQLSDFGGIKDLKNGRFCMFGSTNGLNNVSTNGAYQTEVQGNIDALLGLWLEDGTNLWTTYIGGEDNAFMFGDYISYTYYYENRIYFAGNLYGSEDISTEGAWSGSSGASGDVSSGFFGWFNELGGLEYLSYLPADNSTSFINSIIKKDNFLILTSQPSSYQEWIVSPQLPQTFSGNWDVCILAFDVLSSTEEEVQEIEWTIFPNPTTDRLFVSGCNVVGKKANLYSNDGKLLFSSSLVDGIDVSTLAHGSYFIEIDFPSGRKESKLFLKQ